MKPKLILLIVLFGVFTTCFGEDSPSWGKWSWLTGDWIGEGTGKQGQGEGNFSLKPELDKKILVRRSHIEFPAKEKMPKIIHDDLMIVYPDYAGNPSKAIYFDNEGHTINYEITYTDKAIILTSNKTSNAPAFRLTYTFIDPITINTKFEMSKDGETFTIYLEGTSKKIN